MSFNRRMNTLCYTYTVGYNAAIKMSKRLTMHQHGGISKEAEPKKPDAKDYVLCAGQDQGNPGDKCNFLCDILEKSKCRTKSSGIL